MPGNRAIFERALEGSRAAIQRQAWPDALRDAVRAVQEFPQDLDARSAVAVALYHNQKYAQSAQFFEELRKRRGGDPFTLAYLARAYEGAGALDQAAPVLIEIGEQSARGHRMADALEAFEAAVRLMPADESVRLRLAEFYVDAGDNGRAAEQCTEIARARHVTGDFAGAEEAIDEALGLDPENRAARLLLAELRSVSSSAEPAIEADSIPSFVDRSLQAQPAASPSVPAPTPYDPQLQIDQLIARAGQQQSTGDGTAALRSYEQALALGADRADIHYGLGILLQERGEHERAVEALRQASASDEYGVSAHYALGESLKASGQLREAAAAFEHTVRLVDLESVGRAEADDLIAMYRATAECYAELGELSRAASLYGTLAGFFQGKRWGKELADQFKARAQELTERSMFAKLRLMGTGALPADQVVGFAPVPAPASTQVWGAVAALTSFLRGVPTPGDSSVQPVDLFTALDLPLVEQPTFAPLTVLPTKGCLETTERYVAASTRFTEQGLLNAAVDACHEIIRTDPDYLPVHLRLGELYEREGRSEQALLKYRTLVDTYIVRGRPVDAIDVYFRLIELSPDTVASRTQLSDLLREAGRVEEAAEQALLVAATLFKIGQTNRAIEEFRRVLAWAPPSATVYKEYGQALLKLERWEAALEQFRRAVQLDPSDLVALARINLTMAVLGQNERAMWDALAALLEKLRAEPQHAAAVQGEYRAALMIVDTPILHYLLGLVQQSAGQHASAMLSFQQALGLLVVEQAPQLAPVLVHQALAESYLAQGQAQEAIDELQTARRKLGEQPMRNVSPHSFARPVSEIDLVRRIATAFVSVGDLDSAVKALKRCLQLDPGDVGAFAHLADVFFRQGKLRLALEQFDKLADTYEERQQLDLAIATLQQAVRLAPNTIAVRARLAHLLLRRGTLERGLHELTEVAQLQKNAGQTRDAVVSLQQAAEVYWMLGKHEEVNRAYDAIVAMSPEDIEARQQLVNLHILSGRRDAALAEQHRIAEICRQTQNFNAAIASLHQIIALDPSDTDAFEQLGELLMQVGEHDQALRLYRRLGRLRPGDGRVEALQRAAVAYADDSTQRAGGAGSGGRGEPGQ